MAHIAHNIQERPVLSYITSGSFNGQFFSYETTFNTTTLTTTGALSAVTGATAANCPRGRVLRTNNKKLYPGANPGITTLMVGVYDSISLLSGFIDPNSSVFLVYNGNKSVDIIDGVDLSGGVTHAGPSVFTLGEVIAGRQIRSTGNVALTTVTGTGGGSQVIDVTLSSLYTLTCSASGAATLTLTAPSAELLSNVNSSIRLVVRTTTTNATTITFGTGFRSAGTFSTGATADRYFVITFIVLPFGGVPALYEVSRTSAITP
jgi:hypothetical protein